mgnify:CR=1 FL=1
MLCRYFEISCEFQNSVEPESNSKNCSICSSERCDITSQKNKSLTNKKFGWTLLELISVPESQTMEFEHVESVKYIIKLMNPISSNIWIVMTKSDTFSVITNSIVRNFNTLELVNEHLINSLDYDGREITLEDFRE